MFIKTMSLRNIPTGPRNGSAHVSYSFRYRWSSVTLQNFSWAMRRGSRLLRTLRFVGASGFGTVACRLLGAGGPGGDTGFSARSFIEVETCPTPEENEELLEGGEVATRGINFKS